MTATLSALMAEDGVRLRGGGSQRSALCPFHEDKTPSLSVNVDKGLYQCHGCGAKGDAVTWLERRRGLSKREALQRLKPDREAPPGPAAGPEPSRPGWVSELPRDAAARHEYWVPGAARPAFVICRFAPGGKRPKCLPFSPGKRDSDGRDGWLRQLAVSEKRPLYRLRELAAAPPQRRVMVVEGEKCADAVAGAFPRVAVVAWAGGTKAWKRTDWEPLRGRPVTLVADADEPGRKCMGELAERLRSLGCPDIRAVLPEGSDGRDIADEIEAGGPPRAAAWLKSLAAPWQPPARGKAAGKAAEEPPPEPPAGIDRNEHFEILGNAGDAIAVRLSSHRVLHVARSQLLSPACLISLADYQWWAAMLHANTLTPGACQPVGSALIRAADRKGQVDFGKVFGRGFGRTEEGRYVWHLGDRLLCDGRERGLGELGGPEIYLAGPRIDCDLRAAASPDDRKRVADAVLRYRWRKEVDAKRFLGWLAASAVGGALRWRAHLWLPAAADSGKSWLLKEVAQRVLGGMCVRVADPTPAAMARRMRSDSLPVLVDEAEPDRSWMPGILDIARISAGADGERIRADQADSVQVMQPRFSLLMSSTRVPRLRAADQSRFEFAYLAEQGVSDWPAVRQGIEGSLAGGKGRAALAAVVRDGREIAEKAGAIADEMATTAFGSRPSAIAGALTAGWQWWSGTDEWVAPDLETVMQPRASADAGEALREIVTSTVRSSGGAELPVLSLALSEHRDKIREAADHGVRMSAEGDALQVAPGHPGLARLLRRGDLRGVQVRRLLLQLDGASYKGPPVRFGQLRLRAVSVPEESCRKHGIELRPEGRPDEEDI